MWKSFEKIGLQTSEKVSWEKNKKETCVKHKIDSVHRTGNLKMILLSYSNSSIKGTEILGSILYLSLSLYVFNSWLSFQRLCRLLPVCI